MSFATTLNELMEGAGALAALLMGSDGLPVEEVYAGRLGSAQSEHIGNAGVELGRLLEEVRKASDSFAGGKVREVSIGLEQCWMLVRPVDEDLFLVLVLAPDAGAGKARFLMRRHLPALRAEL